MQKKGTKMQTLSHVKRTTALAVVIALVVVGIAAAVSPQVQAQGAERQNEQQRGAPLTAQERRETAEQLRQEKREAAQTKLEGAKLQACQKRQASINKILQRIAARGEKQLDVFTKISDRTQAFYETKGRTVDNYDELVAAADAKKAAAQSVVEDIKEQSVEFACDGSDPKGAAESFKAGLKLQIAALKEYKQAVKDLIVGVKSAQSTASSEENNSQSEGVQE
jgi:hypothetical protein